MAWKRKNGWYSVPADPHRGMTDVTWMLVAQYADEDRANILRIAHSLNRDPETFFRQLRTGIEEGKLDEARARMLAHGGVYAVRVGGRAKRLGVAV